MSNKSFEQMSALADDELPAAERQFLLKRIQVDDELRRRWASYHLIGDAMRRNLAESTDPSFASRVRQAIEAEAPLTGGRLQTGRNSLGRVVAGLAIAASVAGVALLGLRPAAEQPTGAAPLAQLPDPGPEVARAVWGPGEEPEPGLERYLADHNSFSAAHGVQGMMPSVRLVGLESAE
jgi:sigma-E factor negative regulatory protein RseA